MHQLIDQPTRVDDKTSSVLDVILTSHPALHRKSAVLKFTLNDHYLIYTHMEFENTKPSAVDHNTVKFRVIEYWLENVNDCAITGPYQLDILKCFDSINHTILLKKLEMYGVTITELKWFSSYLNGRKQISPGNIRVLWYYMWRSRGVGSKPNFVLIIYQWFL